MEKIPLWCIPKVGWATKKACDFPRECVSTNKELVSYGDFFLNLWYALISHCV